MEADAFREDLHDHWTNLRNQEWLLPSAQHSLRPRTSFKFRSVRRNCWVHSMRFSVGGRAEAAGHPLLCGAKLQSRRRIFCNKFSGSRIELRTDTVRMHGKTQLVQ